MSQPVTVKARITCYGWPDNDPPHSDAIAFPGTKGHNPPVTHEHAGGHGTYVDPVTVAVAAGAITLGARVYIVLPGDVAGFYGIVEDTCGGCPRKPLGIDVWIGGKGHPDADVLACENRLTSDALVTVTFNPPKDLPVRGPLFDGTCHP